MRQRRGAWGIIRGSGSERAKYTVTGRLLWRQWREARGRERKSGAAWTRHMLTPLVCVPVHFIKPVTLNRFSGSRQSHGVIMLFEMLGLNTLAWSSNPHCTTFCVYSQNMLMWIYSLHLGGKTCEGKFIKHFKMEIYPSGLHIKYIICKLIDFLHKVCPWIDRCNKHLCRSIGILHSFKCQPHHLTVQFK